MMRRSADFAGDLGQAIQRQRFSRPRRLPISFPCRRSVMTNPALRNRAFEENKRLPDSLMKFVTVDETELRLRIMQIEQVDGLDAQVLAAAAQLVGKKCRRHRVHASCNVTRV